MKHQAALLLSYVAGLLLVGNMVVVSPVLAATAPPEPSHPQHTRETLTAKAKQEALNKSQNFSADAMSALGCVSCLLAACNIRESEKATSDP
jgi:hypothetical protein